VHAPVPVLQVPPVPQSAFVQQAEAAMHWLIAAHHVAPPLQLQVEVVPSQVLPPVQAATLPHMHVWLPPSHRLDVPVQSALSPHPQEHDQ
jgi:hypothetical protein